ncbi:PAS domain-containing protein [Candidatus Gracilibacteria bacterium]|nr:PAS domain-containing protein [Candidatus Gracilibacteria bacterium]
MTDRYPRERVEHLKYERPQEDGFAMIDGELRYVMVNEAMAAIAGVPVAEHLGRAVSDVVPTLAPTLEPLLRQVLATGEATIDIEVHGVPGVDGTTRRWLASFSPMRSRIGHVVAIDMVVRVLPVLPQQRGVPLGFATRQEREGFAARVVEASPHLIYVYDLQTTRNRYASERLQQLYGYTQAELDAMGPGFLFHLLHPDDVAEALSNVERLRAAADGEVLAHEYRFRHKDGSWRWLCSYELVFKRDSSGAGRKCWASPKIFRRARRPRPRYAGRPAGSSIATRPSGSGTPRATSCFGARVPSVSTASIGPRPWVGLATNCSKRSSARSCRASPPNLSVAAAGRVSWLGGRKTVALLLSAAAWRLSPALRGSARCWRRTVTGRAEGRGGGPADQRAALALRLRAAGMAAWELDVAAGTISWLPGADAFFGFPPGAFSSRLDNALAIVHPDDRASAAAAVERALKTGVHQSEFRLLRPDGSMVWVRDQGEVVYDSHGAPQRMFGVTQDTTALKAAQEALHVSEERFSVALQGSPVAVFNQDRELRYTWIHNPALDYSAQEVIGATDDDLCERPEDAEHLTLIKRQVLENGVGRRQEVCIWSQSHPRYYDLTVEPLRDQEELVVGITCAAVDITERKRSEDALRQSNERLKLALDRLDGFLYDFDVRSGQVERSDGFMRILGYDPGAVPPTNTWWLDQLHPDDRQDVLARGIAAL